MTWKWTYFIAAVLAAGYVLLANGAPPLAVGLGIGVGAMLTRRACRAA